MFILLVKSMAFFLSGSLSVLAALMDSALDILSQFVLFWAERRSRNVSMALYPAGAAKFEPVGVIICAALMLMGSFAVIKESVESLIRSITSGSPPVLDDSTVGILSMIGVIFVKLFLFVYCKAVKNLIEVSHTGESTISIEAMLQDHLNDCLSNLVAVVAVFFCAMRASLWWLDPAGAIAISFYIMW